VVAASKTLLCERERGKSKKIKERKRTKVCCVFFFFLLLQVPFSYTLSIGVKRRGRVARSMCLLRQQNITSMRHQWWRCMKPTDRHYFGCRVLPEFLAIFPTYFQSLQRPCCKFFNF